MKPAVVTFLVLLSVAVMAAAQGGGGTTNPGGPKCTLPIVRCLRNPCDTIKCALGPTPYKCLPNYCGGCKTDWLNLATGQLLVNRACPPPGQPKSPPRLPSPRIRPSPDLSVPPRGGCICPQVIDPVCANGTTFANSCLASCAGRSPPFTRGACEGDLARRRSLQALAGGGTTNPGGPKCKLPIVNCFVDPCRGTPCGRPPATEWQCLANYCGGCNTDWKNKKTGVLLVNTCPPDTPPSTATTSSGTTNPGGPKCNLPIVNCFVSPCRVTSCKPNAAEWQCLDNYCGGCKTDWKNKKTGVLLVDTCPVSSSDAVGARKLQQSIIARPCPTSLLPVCGADGVTYRSECLALRNGTTVKYSGTCAFPTACLKYNLIYKPVCGNGRTYANACVAKLNGVTDYTAGACTRICTLLCTTTSGCAAPHKCKGNPLYTCTNYRCGSDQILNTGKYVKYGGCSGIYSDRVTGYPAAACYP